MTELLRQQQAISSTQERTEVRRQQLWRGTLKKVRQDTCRFQYSDSIFLSDRVEYSVVCMHMVYVTRSSSIEYTGGHSIGVYYYWI